MQHHLTTKLKSLNLGGLLETLELRTGQATDGNLGYLEYLEMLVSDEIERRQARKLQRRLAKADFEEEKTLEGFDFGFNPNVPVRKLKDLAACHWLDKRENVIICGLAGVGKTHLAQALGHHACRLGRTVLFSKANQLFRQLEAARADASWEDRIREYTKVDVLIIDDFGLKTLTAHQADDLAEIIGERALKGGMIFTSNRRVEEWLGLFPDPVFANAVLDRVAHNAHQIVIEGESYRKNRRPEP